MGVPLYHCSKNTFLGNKIHFTYINFKKNLLYHCSNFILVVCYLHQFLSNTINSYLWAHMSALYSSSSLRQSLISLFPHLGATRRSTDRARTRPLPLPVLVPLAPGCRTVHLPRSRLEFLRLTLRIRNPRKKMGKEAIM